MLSGGPGVIQNNPTYSQSRSESRRGTPTVPTMARQNEGHGVSSRLKEGKAGHQSRSLISNADLVKVKSNNQYLNT